MTASPDLDTVTAAPAADLTGIAPDELATLLAGLAAVLDEVAGTPADQVVPTAAFDADLHVDSLSMVEVVVACEERFAVRIGDDALESLRTVGDAVAFLAAARAAG